MANEHECPGHLLDRKVVLASSVRTLVGLQWLLAVVAGRAGPEHDVRERTREVVWDCMATRKASVSLTSVSSAVASVQDDPGTDVTRADREVVGFAAEGSGHLVSLPQGCEFTSPQSHGGFVPYQFCKFFVLFFPRIVRFTFQRTEP